MHSLKLFAASAFYICALGLVSAAPAQVSVNIGVAPACPYGYYDVAPYNCAPYGYYGPEWFTGGVFVGAGPWFHGPANFHGNVNNHFDPAHGYKGAVPKPNERATHDVKAMPQFKGNEARDGHGHAGEGEHR